MSGSQEILKVVAIVNIKIKYGDVVKEADSKNILDSFDGW